MNTELLPDKGCVLCAVSGGADSMYLLHRLYTMGYPVAAAHFNHGLRGAEADRDEEFVRRFCEENGIPFLSERADVAAFAEREHMGIEEAARMLRYAFLERAADALSAAVVATAHTADDNAETLLMHLIRGTGLHGLGGIPPVRGRIVRPMLDTTRAEVERYLRENDIPHAEDSTNADDAFLRNRIRHEVIPVLRRENPAFSEAAGRTAKLLRQDDEFLEKLAEDFLARNADERSICASALCDQPRPVASRAIRRMAGVSLTAEQTDTVLKVASHGGRMDASGICVARSGDRLYFNPGERAAICPRRLEPGDVLAVPEADLLIRCEKIDGIPPVVYKSFNTFYFECANIYGTICVDTRRSGDRLRLPGRGCSKTLKSLFQERGIPAWERPSVPVLRDEAGILGVYGIGPAERVAAGEDTRDVLKIEFSRLERGGGCK